LQATFMLIIPNSTSPCSFSFSVKMWCVCV
jgi:hypothetical protein